MAEKQAEVLYHIEVSHRPGDFDQDMDFLSKNPKDAYKHYLYVKGKYKDGVIEITRITTTKTTKEISLSKLEKLAVATKV